ncbi:MAG: GNAT family N-acetyltransferase [Lentimicrobiaceae bacterium]|nr:GNAT family N-acetyltransferase [Lentimicrobiaceae bacterium]
MKITNLSQIPFDTIFKAFNQAFADYEMQLNRTQLQAMLLRRGFQPNLSFAALEGSEIVAFTLNGIGIFNGIPTAYDSGTGTLKEYRGQGLATKVFEYSIPYLKEAHIAQYLLEVLQHNTKAVSVYRNLGFEVTREFYYFIKKNEDIHNALKTIDFNFSIQQIEFEEIFQLTDFWDFHPSWQNSFESIERAREDCIFLGAFSEKQLIGYGIFEPSSGDIAQIAVNKQYRRKGAASLLIQEMLKLNKSDVIKVVNTDLLCHSIMDFLKMKNIEATGKQFEMIKHI